MRNLSEFYDPFSFGFTSRLKVNYNYLNVAEPKVDPQRSLNQHIITHEEFVSNTETLLFNLDNYDNKFGLFDLLDYRSFMLIPRGDHHFMTDLHSYEKLCYSVDMLFASWKSNVTMTHGSDRLQFMREHALRTVENQIQDEVKMNNYEHSLLFKLKHYFDFRSLVLLDLADNCVYDSVHYGHKLSSIQSDILIGLYRTEYTNRFNKYLRAVEQSNRESEYSKQQHTVSNENEEPQPSTSTGLSSHDESQLHEEPQPSTSTAHQSQSYEPEPNKPEFVEHKYHAPDPQLLLRKCREWKLMKLQICDTIYGGDLVCKSVVTKTADDLEMMIFDKHNKDPLDSFVTLIQTKNVDDRVSDDLKIARFLSSVSKNGDSGELDKLKSEISELILRDTSTHRFFGSVLNGYLSVSRNIYYESTMATYFDRNNEVVVGEWIRWQGQHISSTVLTLLSKFVSIDTSK